MTEKEWSTEVGYWHWPQAGSFRQPSDTGTNLPCRIKGGIASNQLRIRHRVHGPARAPYATFMRWAAWGRSWPKQRW